ncbi:MAG: hypothetical protein AB7D39_04250 [Pseudodesulfovibrio sp.]|uniref:hypothetical protein n=1 Tax=Pseudodesulfovibrio sp. TaxID=2035812 RepID=UPI003D112DC8
MSRHLHWAGAAFLALILAASLALPSLAGAGGPSRAAMVAPRTAVAAPVAGSPAPNPQPRRTPS